MEKAQPLTRKRISNNWWRCSVFADRAATITKTCLFSFDPLKPHFYIVKLGFTGIYISFLISAQKIDCGYSLVPPRRGGSNEYPQCMFLSRNMKNIRFFLSEKFHFLVVKFSVYSNRRVFVMERGGTCARRQDTHWSHSTWELSVRNDLNLKSEQKISRNSMARTSLGSWKFVLDMGSSSY